MPTLVLLVQLGRSIISAILSLLFLILRDLLPFLGLSVSSPERGREEEREAEKKTPNWKKREKEGKEESFFSPPPPCFCDSASECLRVELQRQGQCQGLLHPNNRRVASQVSTTTGHCTGHLLGGRGWPGRASKQKICVLGPSPQGGFPATRRFCSQSPSASVVGRVLEKVPSADSVPIIPGDSVA